MAKQKPLERIKGIGPGGIPFQLCPRGNKYELRFTHPRSRRQIYASTGTGLVGDARGFAAQYMQAYAVESNMPNRVTVGDLMIALLKEYGEGTRNHMEVKRSWERRLAPIFAHVLASDVRTSDIRDYKAWCRGESVGTGLLHGIKPYGKKLAKGTVNRDLANLRRAFNFGYNGEVITRKPKFEIYDNRKARRKGFITQDQFDRLMMGKMPVWLRALLHVLYAVGIRIDEARNITVGQLDFAKRVIRLEETKNGDARNPPMTTVMYELLKICAAEKSELDFVFTRKCGDQVGDIDKTWHNLRRKAGIEQRFVIHDMRRSAVKNMVDRGVPEKVAMTISGHLTRWVFDGYNITCLKDAQKAAKLIEAGAEQERADAEKAKQETAELERLFNLTEEIQ